MIKALMGAAGGGDKVYVDDVFKTFLYKGLGGQGLISSGIQYATEGGMVMVKSRTHSAGWGVFDTERENGFYLPTESEDNGGNISAASGSSPFLRDGGFRWNANQNDWNSAGQNMASYNFRKAKGFFDIVTYTANGLQKTISHSLGCIPGLVMIKNRSRSARWLVASSAIATEGWNGYLEIEDSGNIGTGYPFGSHTPTATNFTITTGAGLGNSAEAFNKSGDDYVVYLFADGDNAAAQIFGAGGNQSILKCGNYTGNANATGPVINLGWEPQWILIKCSEGGTGDWRLFDTMRGITSGYDSNDYGFTLNDSSAEQNSSERLETTQTGFKITSTANDVNRNNGKFLYLAIRRPDTKVAAAPTSPNEVFWMATGNSASSMEPCFISDLPIDMAIFRQPASTMDWVLSTRLTDRYYSEPNTNASEGYDGHYSFDSNKGWNVHSLNATNQSWMWRRHSGFDVVAYKGNETAGHQISHSMNKIPEMIWCKARNTSGSTEHWGVYHEGISGTGKSIFLNLSNAATGSMFNATTPTSTYFELSNDYRTNGPYDYIAMLFASVNGISKVGYYTGTGNALSVTTGFQPRFLIIKNASSGTGDSHWWVVDTTRGWGSGDDNCLRLDTDNAAVTGFNLGAPTSTGFDMPANSGNSTAYNKSGDRYIYYAHA